jgi:hypothetical protein
MRFTLVVFLLLAVPLGATEAQLSIQFGTPNLSLSFRQQQYPTLVAVPGYPVYYDPNANGNYFFYDGMYWVYERDSWYASDWFDGPWSLVSPQVVPDFLLRVPVRYYRQPPVYFRGWQADAAPRWGEHWGNDWQRQRGGWDRWDRRQVPAAAPLPTYQRQYSGDRYPHAEQQQSLRNQNYRHEPREEAVRAAHREPPRQEPRPQQPAKREEPRQQQPPQRQEPRPQQPAQQEEPRRQQPQQEAPHQQPPAKREEPHQQPPAKREEPRQQQPQQEAPHQQQPQREAPHQPQDQGRGNDRGGERGERDGGGDRR